MRRTGACLSLVLLLLPWLVPDALQGSNFTQRARDKGLRTATSIKNNYEISPSFGGPVVRDRIWLYTAAATFGQENHVGGMYNPAGGRAGCDVYNVLNVDTVMTRSNAFAIWQRAQSLIMARFAKLSMQVDS